MLLSNCSTFYFPVRLFSLTKNETVVSEHDIWAKSKNYVNKRIDSLNLSTQQGPVIAFYLLGLIYKHGESRFETLQKTNKILISDCSLLKNFVEVLKKQYVKAHINNKVSFFLSHYVIWIVSEESSADPGDN